MLNRKLLVCVIICLMGVRVTVGFGFEAYAQNDEGQMEEMGFVDLDSIDDLEEGFAKTAWSWNSLNYGISFNYDPYNIVTQEVGEPDGLSSYQFDGAAAGTMGQMHLKCLKVEFNEIVDNDVHTTTSTKNECMNLEKDYTPGEDFKGDYRDGANDIYMMMSKANAWMKEKCAGDDDKIISVAWDGGQSMAIKFGYTITVMAKDQVDALEAQIAKIKEEDDPGFTVNQVVHDRRRRLILV